MTANCSRKPNAFTSTRGYGLLAVLVSLGAGVPGCQIAIDSADLEVYGLIQSRQQRALGETRQTKVGSERYPDWKAPPPGGPDSPHDMAPHPVTPGLPPEFTATTQPAATEPTAQATTAPATETVAQSRPAEEESAPILTLEEALRYAFHNARQYQSAKEDLYLAALALSLERHLWTPQLTGQISSQYANYGEVRNFDHAMDAVSQVAVEQRLPYGGEVTAKMLTSFMRDLTHHVTTGETGAIILGANIPLLRGAGRVAYESRYQAERDLIYAVRTFEQYRRVLAVNIASDYFNLQQLRQQIVNVTESIKSFTLEAERTRALSKTGRWLELEAQRAEQNRLTSLSRRVDAIEQYQSSLDAFKIRIGMPMSTHIDVVLEYGMATSAPAGQPLDKATSMADAMSIPQITEETAIEVSLKYRLDLLNEYDRIDDTRRGVDIAENNLLPDLSALGSVQLNSDPTHLSSWRYSDERATWRGQVVLDLPLDRYRERNALRTSLINQRRAERRYQEARDLVAAQVRRAIRRVYQQEESLRIQQLSQDLALVRRQGARIRFDQGRVSNREVVDAENDLLDARNRFASAQADLRVAILEFRRDTGTLQLDEDGLWPRTPQPSGQGG